MDLRQHDKGRSIERVAPFRELLQFSVELLSG